MTCQQLMTGSTVYHRLVQQVHLLQRHTWYRPEYLTIVEDQMLCDLCSQENFTVIQA